MSNTIIPGIFMPGSLPSMILVGLAVPLVLIFQFCQDRLQQNHNTKLLIYIYSFLIGFLQNLIVAGIPNIPSAGKFSLYVFLFLIVLGPPIANLIAGRNPFRPGLFRSLVSAASGTAFFVVTIISFYIFFGYQFLLPAQQPDGTFNLPLETKMLLYLIIFFVFLLLSYITGVIVHYLSAGRKAAIWLCSLGTFFALILIMPRDTTCCSIMFIPLLLSMLKGRRDMELKTGIIGAIDKIWHFIKYDVL